MADSDSNASGQYSHMPNSLELLRQKYANQDSKEPTQLSITSRERTDLNPESEAGLQPENEDPEKSERLDSGVESHQGKLLIEAAEKGDVKTVKSMLENSAIDPDKKTKYQARSALHLACGYGQYDVAEELLQAGADPMQFSYAGRTPLHEACQGGHPRILQLLLDFTREVDTQDRDGQSPAHIAALNGEVKCLEILQDKDASLVIEDKAGRQPAHLAAMRNHRLVLEYLYEEGIDLECTDEMGKLPVHHAASHGAMEALLCLIERDCDITIGDNLGNLPMHYAAWHDHLDLLRFLVKQGSLTDFTNTENKTAVHVAAQHGGIKVLHWLLEKGCDPNAVDIHGNTAGHYAASAGKAACYHCLLQHRANIYIKNKKGDDTLFSGKKAGHPLLMEKAMKGEIMCPTCKKKSDLDKWREAHRPTPVLREVTDLQKQAYTSPLPKLQKVPTQIQMNSEKRTQKQALKSAGQSQRRVSATPSKPAPTVSVTRMEPKQEIKGKKLPQRDLPAKYFGDHLEINDLYKFKF